MKKKPFHIEKYLQYFSQLLIFNHLQKKKTKNNLLGMIFKGSVSYIKDIYKRKQDVSDGSSHVLLKCSGAYILPIWYTALMLR